MCQSVNYNIILYHKNKAFQNAGCGFVFVVAIKIIFGYNFVAPLK